MRVLRGPVFGWIIAAYMVYLAYQETSVTLGIAAGLIVSIALDETFNLYVDRKKEVK